MNRMIEFSKEARTTSYFRDYEIMRIKIAYRIMEYLAPDNHFPPKINKNVQTLIFNDKYAEAVREIINVDLDIECSSSHGTQDLCKEAIELIEYLMPIYMKSKATEKDKKKIELLKQLKELECEE